jgi:DNA modification methylase
MTVRILVGDCVERLNELPDNSVDSVVCDPPYHLTNPGDRRSNNGRKAGKGEGVNAGQYGRLLRGFMGQTWDGGDVAFRPETWAEVMRVLKPGGHLVAFSGTRTYHRMAVAIEDAGFEVRDMLSWLYGSGFPKSLDVSKAIDKATVRDMNSGALVFGRDLASLRALCRQIREAMETRGLKSRHLTEHFGDCHPRLIDHWAARDTDSQPSCPTWEQWQILRGLLGLESLDADVWKLNGRKGKPGEAWTEAEVLGEHEGAAPGLVGMRFDGDNSIRDANSEAAREWQGWGTALKPACEPICLARKPLSEKSVAANVLKWGTGALNVDACRIEHSEECKPMAAQAGGDKVFGQGGRKEATTDLKPAGRWPANIAHDGSDEVVAGFPESESGIAVTRNGGGRRIGGNGIYGGSKPHDGEPDSGYSDSGSAARFFYCAKATTEERGEGNNHPTVKPVALMEWLVKLVTPKGGTVCDPFMGSGSTALACDRLQFDFIGCELSAEYAAIAADRVRAAAGMFANVSIESRGPATRQAEGEAA